MRSPLSALMLLSLISAEAVWADDQEYFPLEKGRERISEIVNQLPDGTRQLSRMRSTIVESLERDGKIYWRLKSDITGDQNFSTTVLSRRDSTGVYVVYEELAATKEQRAIVFPLKAGNTWEFNNRNQPNKVTVVGFEDVTIGSKTYQRCVHFHLVSPDGKVFDRWSAPNVGEVKAEIEHPNGMKSSITIQEIGSTK